MSRYNHEPDIIEVLGRILKRLDDLETKPRIGFSSMAPGQTLLVLNAAGESRLVVGTLHYSDGSSGYGFLAKRSSGEKAFTVEGTDPDHQYAAVYDKAGNIVMSDDAGSGFGLARPWIAIPWTDSDLVAAGTTSASFVNMGTGILYKQHSKITIDAIVTVPASTTVEYKVNAKTNTDITLGGPGTDIFINTVTGPITRLRVIHSNIDVPGLFGERVYLDILCRDSAGVGVSRAIFGAIWSRQS
jgi:hypothetical protein